MTSLSAAQAHEAALMAATGGTLVMDVESITANAHFGCAMGTLRAGGGSSGRTEIAMAFCGVWRFDEEGRAVEHWENAEDPGRLVRWLRGSRG